MEPDENAVLARLISGCTDSPGGLEAGIIGFPVEFTGSYMLRGDARKPRH
jgi:hypothetical protein